MIFVPPFFGRRTATGQLVNGIVVGQMEIKLDRPFEVRAEGRRIGNLDADRIDQITGVMAFAFTPVVEQKLRSVMAGRSLRCRSIVRKARENRKDIRKP